MSAVGDKIGDALSGVKDSALGGIQKVFRWAEKGNTETNRKMRAFMVNMGIFLIGATFLTVVLSSTGAFTQAGISISATSLPMLVIGVGVAGFGFSLVINQLVLKHLFKGANGDQHRRTVSTALNTIAALCLIGAAVAILGITYGGGIPSAAHDNTSMIVLSSTLVLLSLNLVRFGLLDSLKKQKYRVAFATAPKEIQKQYHNQGKGTLDSFGFSQRLMSADTRA